MSRLVLPFLIAASLSLAACVSTRPIGDQQPCPCTTGWACDPFRNICVPNGSPVGDGGILADGAIIYGNDGGTGAPATYSSADVQTALAQCDLPHGPALAPTSYGDKRALMVGSWIDCLSSDQTVYAPALAFAPDGTWQRYLSDGNGGLAIAYGVKNQGNYTFPYPDGHATDGNPYVTVSADSFDSTPDAFGDGPLTLETSPNRIHAVITYLDQTIEIWLVRLPAA